MIKENPNIDFTNVMKNKEHYFEVEHIETILNYFYEREEYMKYMFFLVLYRSGRRVTELLGKPPYSGDGLRCNGNYKGLRPIDVKVKQRAVEWEILKKNPVRLKKKDGKAKSDLTIAQLRFKKAPKRIMIPIDKELFDHLVWYINYYNIHPEDRLFPISRFTANKWLKEAVKHTGIRMNLGKKKVKIRGGPIVETYVQPHLHMFRHSYSIHTLLRNRKNPVALPTLTRLLQHSNMEITRHYLQFSDYETKEFLDQTWSEGDGNEMDK